MKKLTQYEKRKGVQWTRTSVRITEDQAKYFKERNINLSLLIRDLLTDLIKKGGV